MAAEVYLSIRIDKLEVLGLVDSGNSRGCLISKRLAQRLNLQIEQTNSKAAGVSGNNIEIDGIARNVEFFVDGDLKFCEDFYVIENMTIPMNLGSLVE
jgi:hypothetical protein